MREFPHSFVFDLVGQYFHSINDHIVKLWFCFSLQLFLLLSWMFDSADSVLERVLFVSFSVDVVTTHLILFEHDQIIKLVKLLKIQAIFLYAHFLWKQNNKSRKSRISSTANEAVIFIQQSGRVLKTVPAACLWASESWGLCSSAQEAEPSAPSPRCCMERTLFWSHLYWSRWAVGNRFLFTITDAERIITRTDDSRGDTDSDCRMF